MKILTVCLITFFSLSLWSAEGQKCLSHGQCQDAAPIESVACFKVITGLDHNGNVTCRMSCRNLLAASYCKKKHPRQIVGRCHLESFPSPTFDPNDPNACNGAVDLAVLDIKP